MKKNTENTRMTAARAFVRTLNILLKFARMYEFGHPRTVKQYDTAWTELRTALGSEEGSGLLLAVSSDQLLLDGTPLESSAAEKAFARMLSSAGIASIHFSPKVTQASLAKFVRGFPTGTGARPAQLAEQLKAALQGDPHIHVNEVCFVPADSAVAKSTVARQLATRSLGMNSEQTDEIFNDPEKLLQLIMAAEGAKARPNPSPGSGGDRDTPGGNGGGTGTNYYARSNSNIASEGAPTQATFGSEGQAINAAGDGSVSALDGANGRASGPTSTWNIVNPGERARPLQPEAGGFWLKGDHSTGSSSISGSESGAGSRVGPNAASGNRGVANYGSSVAGEQFQADAIAEHGNRLSRSEMFVANTPGRWAHASSDIRTSRSARGGPGSLVVETGLTTISEDELRSILQVLAQIARTPEATKERLDSNAFQSRLSTLPRRARFTVSQALSALAAQAPAEAASKTTLIKLAEHIAIRFALEKFERGDLRVNAVRELLMEMNQELDGLRRVLGVYEEKMTRAGIDVQPHTEVLAQEFWTHVSEEKKKSVLESADVWCVPSSRIREFVQALRKRGEDDASEKILRNYASSITSESAEIRQHVATGLAEMASLYAASGEHFFIETIRQVGVQLAEEKDSQLQSLVSAAFVRLSQEAAKIRSYPAVQRSVELIEYVELERPGIGNSLRPRIGIEDRLPEFIDDALRAGGVPSGLKDLLRRIPQRASEQIAARFTRAGFREDCELLVSMVGMLGPDALDHLRLQLQRGNPTEAVNTVGILARLDHEALGRELSIRMKQWQRINHDRVVRQIGASGALERGHLLLGLFDSLDPVIRPLALDEIGMSGERSASSMLLRLAEGDLPLGASAYVRLKAMEALGRLRIDAADPILRKIVEARKTWRWTNPSELRMVAAQAMEKIDPEWLRNFMPKSGLTAAEFSIEALDADPNSSAMRQRRYARLRLEHPLPATTTNLKQNYQLEIPEMALGGGIAICEQNLHPGSLVELRLDSAQKSINAQTIVRDANTQARAFEVVDMDLEERSKLRKILAQLGNARKQSTAHERSRRGMRTIKTNFP